ncbi:hypothetical protein KSS87_017149 [Heliosperma pusillum]|nr:hypothetical protein KSS87_017149 [Heliosperma pusillum]
MGSIKMANLTFILAMLVIAPYASQAVNCGQVVNWLMPCLNFLKTGAGPTSACCTGVQTLYNTASTTPDKRVACACIKQSAKAYGINYGYANALPSKCNVDVDYNISPDFDCSSINN